MANDGSAPSPKPFKWLNKSLRLTFPRRSSHSKSSSSNLSTPRSPTSTLPGSNLKRATSADREHELREVFRRFDADGDGKISALELRAYFASIGEYMSHEEAQSVVGELDTDGDCLIDFGDFLKLMKTDGGRGGVHVDDLRRAFEMFEDEKGSGSITPKGLQAMLCRLGDAKSYEECEDMIRVYDIDGNGVLDFQEFHQMMA